MANEIIKVPDIGGATGVDVIEILVKEGDKIEVDTPLVTLESDKASMEIPSPKAGIVKAIHVKLNDKVAEGSELITLAAEAGDQAEPEKKAQEPAESTKKATVDAEKESSVDSVSATSSQPQPEASQPVPMTQAPTNAALILASPAVRRLARELGVDLTQVKGSDRKGRITKEDVTQFVKQAMQSPARGSALAIPESVVIDFSKFGPVDPKPLNKIKKATATNLHRAWLTVPHVTQFDEADITDLEHFRKSEAEKAVKSGYKLTLLAFVCKVVCKALQVFPQFNASLDATGENLIFKQYYHIGIAVETPNGLVVPVIKNADQLTVSEIAQEMGRLSAKARDKGLMPADMTGGSFTISSLGGIGGTAFTPIVNHPEVAILGLSRSQMKPVYSNGGWVPRLMLPLSLSYDHRVIDGAEGARFTRFLSEALADIRKIIL